MTLVNVAPENESDAQGKPGTSARTFFKGPASSLNGAVAAELGMHPRYTDTARNGFAVRPRRVCPGALSEKRILSITSSVSLIVGISISHPFHVLHHAEPAFFLSCEDMTSQIVENIWPLSAAASHIDAVSSPIGVLPLRTFIQEILRRGRTSYSTLHVTLYYMIRFHVLSHKLTKEQSRSPSRMRAMHCGRRMFLTALILASKYLQNDSYSACAWSKISGFNTSEINHNELMFR